MTKNAEKLVYLLGVVREASYQDGRAMHDPRSTQIHTDATLKATREADYALIMHLRTMTEEDLKSL